MIYHRLNNNTLRCVYCDKDKVKVILDKEAYLYESDSKTPDGANLQLCITGRYLKIPKAQQEPDILKEIYG
jgi:hypothetical protein